MHWLNWWPHHRHRRHHHHPHHPHRHVHLWFVAGNFAVELKPNVEIEMAENLQTNQIDNLSIAAVDSAGNPVTPTFDSPPSWSLSDPSGSFGLAIAADGMSATLSPGSVGSTATVGLSAVAGGTTFTASLDVTMVQAPSGIASISIVATPAPIPTAPVAAPAGGAAP